MHNGNVRPWQGGKNTPFEKFRLSVIANLYLSTKDPGDIFPKENLIIKCLVQKTGKVKSIDIKKDNHLTE
ncbi:hypothetical protein EB241_17495 [Erwinia psidii]|uniref:Uncharacterized protein n=1 Tax=Erwinia psidii TaxID=69224 RepID=A0A3N6SAL7_9GAMM|nr:hypothetical protein EB241_17495 [Erwinia psidii]